MSHFALLWKARTIEKYRQNYENEKINSILLSKAEIPEKTLFRRWKHYSHDMKKHLSRTFSKWYPEGSTVSNFVINFREMKFFHILLRSAFGFLWGLILTYLCFVFFVFQLSLSLNNATIICSLIGVLLTLGLTLSNRMRCLVFLLIPQLFSRVGRYTLTCYALVLILTGPATNTLKNLEILSESMACSQEQIKLNVRQINESIKKPFNSIKDAINMMMEKMKRITLKLKITLVKINRLMISVASIIQSNFEWLENIANKCNTYFGTPYERCTKALRDYVKDYHAQPDDSLFDTVMEMAELSCEYMRPYEKFCVAPDYVEETFLATIKRKVRTFTNRIKSMLFIHIKIQHSYTFVGNISRTPSQVAAGIVTEIRNRADPIFTWLSWSSCVTSLFLLLILFRAKYYQHMYETRSRFDNRFITKEFRELDLKRLREGRDTVLPLNRRERAKYVTTTSFRLVASEKVYLNRSVIFMVITTFKLLIHMVADYSLYWVLVTIRLHGGRQTFLGPGLTESGVNIIGQGYVARFLESVFDVLDIPLLSPPKTPNDCLPKPYPPDFKRYGQIGILILLLWLFALFEPYGLRMRHLIMGHYRPERAKARAVWLYNHILRTRGSFMKFARRKLHREYKYHSYRDMTFKICLKSILRPILTILSCFGINFERPSCLLCNITQECEDCHCRLIRCGVRKCPGVYCDSCFRDIGKMCTICITPSDYGDLSDVSLEKGSSDEDSDNDAENHSSKRGNESFADIEKPPYSKKYDYDKESDDEDGDDDPFYKVRSEELYPLLHMPLNINQDEANGVIVDERADSFKENIGLKQMDLYRETIYVKSEEDDESYYIQFSYNMIEIYRAPNQRSNINHKHINYQCSFSNIINKNLPISRRINATKLIKSLNNKIKCRKKGRLKTKGETKGSKSPVKNDESPTKEPTEPPIEKADDDKEDTEDKNAKKNNKNEKSKKNNKKKSKEKSPKIIKNKSNKIKKPKHFQRILIKLLPCTGSGNKSKKLPQSPSSNTSPTKKHNRKRKRKKSKSPKRYDKQDSRNYRISSYLSELEWIKPKTENKAKNTSLNNIDQTKVQDENLTAVDTDPHNQTNESHVKVYDVMIPKLKLNFSSESLNKNDTKAKFKKTPQEKFELDNSESENPTLKKESSIRSIPKHFKHFVYRSIVANSMTLSKKANKMPIDYKRNIENIRAKKNEVKEVTRAVKYFNSAHPDVDEIHINPNYSNIANLDSSMDMSDFTDFLNDTTFLNDEKETDENVLFRNVGLDVKLSSSTGWSRLKRDISKKFQDFGGPLSIMKGLYSSLFIASKQSRATSQTYRYSHSEKSVLVRPNVCTCACQKNFTRPPVHSRHVQIPNTYKVTSKNGPDGPSKWRTEKAKCRNVHVDVRKSTCTCATQHFSTCRDVGTYKNVEDILSESQLESELSSARLETSETSTTDDSDTGTPGSIFTAKSGETSKTDTTICSLATVKTEFPKKKRTKVVTLSNQGTITDAARVCDVSTLTDDWWSPIVERKNRRPSPRNVKQRSREVKKVRNKGVMTTVGRIVKFQSHAQIIPRNDSLLLLQDDVLSPSRYLLESQKYYNELFSSRFYSPHVLNMIDDIQRRQRTECVPSKISSRGNYRLNRKTKRLEDCYSPRRWKRF